MPFLPLKQRTMQKLASSFRPRTPQTANIPHIQSQIYVLNQKLLGYPIKNKDYLSSYKIVSNIASGAYGQTFLATSASKQLLAIKKLNNHIKQHIQEAEFLSELRCPTIPKIFDCFTDQNSLYISEEAGEITLEELLSYYIRLPESLIWSVAADLLTAIQSCHQRQIAHLDVKPSNILLFKNESFQEQELKDDNTSMTSSRESVNQTPDCMSYSNIGLLAASQLHFSRFNQQPEVLQDPLKKLSLQIDQLPDQCTFMLIDFGNAQRAPFKSDTTCGDSRYLYKCFLQTSVPSFRADLFSVGLLLLECYTGVELPVQGEEYQHLREEKGIFDVLENGPELLHLHQQGDPLLCLIVSLLYDEGVTVDGVMQCYKQHFTRSAHTQISAYRQLNDHIIVIKRPQQRLQVARSRLTLATFVRVGGRLPFSRRVPSTIKCFILPIATFAKRPVYFFEDSNSDSDTTQPFFRSQEDAVSRAQSAAFFQVASENDLGISNLNSTSARLDDENTNANASNNNNVNSSANFNFNGFCALKTTTLGDAKSEITLADGAKQPLKSLDDASVEQENLQLSRSTSSIDVSATTSSLSRQEKSPTSQDTNSSNVQLALKPVSYFAELALSALEYISGTASLIYVQPLKKCHATPTAPLRRSSETSQSSDLLQFRLASRFRPKSGNYNVLSQNELLSQGYQTVNSGVDYFENKSQTNVFWNFLATHRAVLFAAINAVLAVLRYMNGARVYKALQLCIVAIYLVFLQKVNKHNLELNFDADYKYIRYTNIYYDPAKIKNVLLGFVIPGIFTARNWLAFSFQAARESAYNAMLFACEVVVVAFLGRM